MQGFLTDLKYTWYKPNNVIERLIIVNVAVFLLLNVMFLFSPRLEHLVVSKLLGLPSSLFRFLFAPWTIITYFFTQEGFSHILFNMLNLYWFGIVLQSLVKPRNVLTVYFYGGIAGGISYLVLGAMSSYIGVMPGSFMIGSSAAVFAIILAAATLAPDYKFYLLFLGPVKIKYLALVSVLLSLFALRGMNTGGELAHLAGAATGYIYIKYLRSRWSLGGLFSSKQQRPVKAYVQGNKKIIIPADGKPSQEIIDAILDKISEKGYEKLTAEEKQILFRASQEDLRK